MTRPVKAKLATLADLDGRTVAARMAKDTFQQSKAIWAALKI